MARARAMCDKARQQRQFGHEVKARCRQLRRDAQEMREDIERLQFLAQCVKDAHNERRDLRALTRERLFQRLEKPAPPAPKEDPDTTLARRPLRLV